MTVVARHAQVSPAAATATKLYTAATVGGSIVAIMVNNRMTSSGNATIGIEVRIAGAGTTSADFEWEGVVAQSTPQRIPAISLGNTDEIWVTSDIVTVNFNADGLDL